MSLSVNIQIGTKPYQDIPLTKELKFMIDLEIKRIAALPQKQWIKELNKFLKMTNKQIWKKLLPHVQLPQERITRFKP